MDEVVRDVLQIVSCRPTALEEKEEAEEVRERSGKATLPIRHGVCHSGRHTVLDSGRERGPASRDARSESPVRELGRDMLSSPKSEAVAGVEKDDPVVSAFYVCACVCGGRFICGCG